METNINMFMLLQYICMYIQAYSKDNPIYINEIIA